MTLRELQDRYYRSNPDGHYFDRQTLRFFGSTQRKAEARTGEIVYSEKQTKAPEGVAPWRAVLFSLDGTPTDSTGTGWTRREAIVNAYLSTIPA